MGFWQEVNDGPGFDIDALTPEETEVIRGFIREQYLAALGAAAPELVEAADAVGIDAYHTLPIGFDHGEFWSKGRRVLPESTVAAIEKMAFFRRIRERLPSAEIYPEDLMWRIVRPGEQSDVGPVHADKWFWDAGNGSISDDRDRLKVWIALYTEPGLNGLCVKPHSHTSDEWKRHFELKHGIMKPVLDEDESSLGMELLPLKAGEMVFFHDGLLHGGVVNRAETCRVSLELTVTYRIADGAAAPPFRCGPTQARAASDTFAFGPEKYSFITPVWGDAYVDRFLKVSLPSQLSAGNLGAIPPGKGEYLIYTRREHAKTILRSAAYRQLKTMMSASVRSLDDLPDPRLSKNPHELQTAAYMRGIKAGAGTETAFVFLTPDILIGDGTYRNMVRLAEDGKRIHLVAGIRMLTEGAVSCVVQHREKSEGAEVAIPSRDLVRSCLDNLHPISLGHIVTDGGVRAAQHLYWRVGEQGLLARGFHLHPLFVWPRNPDAVIRNTLDDEYVSRACPDRADWHTVTDSDEMCVIEFSDRRHKVGMVGSEQLSDAAVSAFLRECTTPDHREHVRHRIRFLARHASGNDWDAPQAESDRTVEKYLDLHDHGAPDDVKLGRVDVVRSPEKPVPTVSMAKFLLRGLAIPLRFANRTINFMQYRYLERLNATILHQQKQLDQAHKQLTNVSRMVEEMTERLAQAEEAARSAEIRATDNAIRRRRRRRTPDYSAGG